MRGSRRQGVRELLDLRHNPVQLLRQAARPERPKSIGEGTVRTHVSNILSKLHLADRTQVAVYAWQQGLVNREQMGRK